jgi:hypothetical protein
VIIARQKFAPDPISVSISERLRNCFIPEMCFVLGHILDLGHPASSSIQESDLQRSSVMTRLATAAVGCKSDPLQTRSRGVGFVEAAAQTPARDRN